MQEFFKGGITNGNDWYPVYNGMQDWLYVARGCRALTLELWDSKWPSSDLLPVSFLLETDTNKVADPTRHGQVER